MNNFDYKEGIAFAVILSVLAALASSNLDLTPNQRIMSWLAFVVVSGASINVIGISFKKQLLAALFPSLSFVVTLLFIFAINYFTGISLIGSVGEISFDGIQDKTGLSSGIFLILFHIFILFITGVGILVAIQAGNILRKIIRTIIHLDPKDISKKEKVFNSILRLLLTVVAIFSVFG